jgi:glucose-6-phosphate isomerase
MAFYEHATVVEGALWGVNSFDQFGVEMGKRIAGAVLAEIDGTTSRGGSDAATEAALDWYLRHRGSAS